MTSVIKVNNAVEHAQYGCDIFIFNLYHFLLGGTIDLKYIYTMKCNLLKAVRDLVKTDAAAIMLVVMS